jgi:Mg2+/citrate symporter
LSDLAEHIAAIENDTTPERLTSSERKRVYVGLYQCHLPKMDDAGAIDYNQQRGLIRRTEQTERFESYLKQGSDEPSRRWYRYYGAIAALGVIPMLVSGSVSATVLTGLYAVILLAVGFCAVSHWWLQSSSDDDDGVQMPG